MAVLEKSYTCSLEDPKTSNNITPNSPERGFAVSLLAEILNSVRSAALLGGLRRVTRIQVDIGREALVEPEVFVAALAERFRGDLLGECQIQYRVVGGPTIRVQSLEGVPISPPSGVA